MFIQWRDLAVAGRYPVAPLHQHEFVVSKILYHSEERKTNRKLSKSAVNLLT